MGRKLRTNEEFLAEAKIKHGDRYSYDRCNYKKALEYVTITCPIHGDFEQTAHRHLMGQGCSKCHYTGRTMTVERFKERCANIHNGKYKYDKVSYSGIMKEVTITCPIHGDFEQTANNHLRGQGCGKCKADKARSSKEDFIKKAVEVHGDRYVYDDVVYVVNDKKVNIRCKKHGVFKQTPTSHKNGSGCPKCTEKWAGDGVVYVMSTPEGHNKIGIAKSGTEYNRLTQILKSQQTKSATAITGLSLVCAYSFTDGSFTEARKFEGKAHRHFKARRKVFQDKFDGSGEFFTVPVSEICSYLEQQGGKLVTVKGAP